MHLMARGDDRYEMPDGRTFSLTGRTRIQLTACWKRTFFSAELAWVELARMGEDGRVMEPYLHPIERGGCGYVHIGHIKH